MRARGRFMGKKINGRLYNSFPFVTAVRKAVESLMTFRKNLPTLLQLDEFALNFSVDVVKIQKNVYEKIAVPEQARACNASN